MRISNLLNIVGYELRDGIRRCRLLQTEFVGYSSLLNFFFLTYPQSPRRLEGIVDGRVQCPVSSAIQQRNLGPANECDTFVFSYHFSPLFVRISNLLLEVGAASIALCTMHSLPEIRDVR